MLRWELFSDRELQMLSRILGEYCERQEDTSWEEGVLADEIDAEIERRPKEGR